ncbi:hypothetical protein [Macellibacteroides fermentans]|uniref:hypothetical protein n=1 Tax=Macellibacteroides fermentans TaxID=879969 RepID=UPI00406C2508
MKIGIRHSESKVWFRRWSRKSYAVFASLHKQVLISRVGKSITEASLSKEKKGKQFFIFITQEETAENDASYPDPPLSYLLPDTLFALTAVLISETAAIAHAITGNYNLKYSNRIILELGSILIRFFVSLKIKEL